MGEEVLTRTRFLALPTADSVRRGQFVLLENPGVADDKLYYGMQLSGGGYSLKEIPYGPISIVILIQEDDSTVEAAATTLDFRTALNVTSSPSGEANISVDLGTSATQAAAGDHTHAVPIGVFHDSSTDTSPTTSTITDTSGTFYEGGSGTFTLPSGTWAGTLLINQRLAHSADGTTQWRAVLGGTNGSSQSGSCSSIGGTHASVIDVTGLASGSVAWASQARPTSAGTLTFGASTALLIATRTA